MNCVLQNCELAIEAKLHMQQELIMYPAIQHTVNIGSRAINTLHQYWIKMVAIRGCRIIQKTILHQKSHKFQH